MIEWFQQLQDMLFTENEVVLVTVASIKGSTPREPGAKMLVSKNKVCNTIGGGHLEYKAIQIARNMLSDNRPNELQRFSLAAGLGQCCGGVATLFFEVIKNQTGWMEVAKILWSDQQDFVQVIPVTPAQHLPRLIVTADRVFPDESFSGPVVGLARTMLQTSATTSIKNVENSKFLFDPITATNFNVYLFGAGHVGEAVIKQLAEQPCQVNWIDTRDDQLPETTPANVKTVNTDVPEAVIDEAPVGSYFLVMTHDHQLDQVLTEQILKRNDFNYFGLIGSTTKRKKFEHRLLDRGINKQQLSRLTCPIGISGINSKRPAAIALAVTAELIQCFELSQNKKLSAQTDRRESLHL